VNFAVPAESYDRFMGRYSTLLSPLFAEFAGIHHGLRVLDVGCGPGALTGELVARLGDKAVAAVDPSEPFVAALASRYPGVRVERAGAEAVPFDDCEFDAALAQLVVHFMTDPVLGLQEMARVTRPAGVVAACVWDHAGGQTPISAFWAAARDLDPDLVDESGLPGARQGHLSELFRAAGLVTVEESLLSVELAHASFDDWWEPLTLGVGPAGAYVATLDPDRRATLREHCRSRLPGEPLIVTAQAWAARGRV
jgi:SAM-dependent methyltransferase